MNPLVSIIIPVYNGANYVAEAIDSALAQTYKNIEILVVNDGSSDDGATEKVVLSYGDKVRYIKKENGGVSTALNRGIEEMKGEYFSWLSHDDLYFPEKIEKQVSLIETEKDIILCSGKFIDAEGKPINKTVKALNKKLTGRQFIKEYLHGFGWNGLGFLIPKTAFETAGKFDESMRFLQDFDMWLRMTWYDYRFVCHKDELVANRMHRQQVTNRHRELFKNDGDAYAKKHLRLLKETEVCERGKLLKLYFMIFSNGSHPEEAKEMKALLKKEGYYSASVFFRSLWFGLRGRTRKALKAIRRFLRKFI